MASVRWAAPGFEEAALGAGSQQPVEGQVLGGAGEQPRPELGQPREGEAGIGQVQAQGVRPVDAGAHRLGGLPVRESLRERHHRHQRQPPRRLRRPAAAGVERGEGGVGEDRAQRVPHLQAAAPSGERGTGHAGRLGGDRTNGVGMQRHGAPPSVAAAEGPKYRPPPTTLDLPTVSSRDVTVDRF